METQFAHQEQLPRIFRPKRRGDVYKQLRQQRLGQEARQRCLQMDFREWCVYVCVCVCMHWRLLCAGIPIADLQGPEDVVSALFLSDSGDVLASVCKQKHTIRLWDTKHLRRMLLCFGTLYTASAP
jgi:hypothetical protein